MALGWLSLIASTVFAERLSSGASPIIRMFAIIICVFFGMKIIVTAVEAGESPPALAILPWFAFVFGWAGMRPGIFRNLGRAPLPEGKKMILSGLVRIAAGLALIWGARTLSRLPLDGLSEVILISVLLLIGYSLFLHFGILLASAGFWRLLGVKAYPLFNAPLLSLSLSDFWSRRWNIAFSEMTSITVFRPLRRILGGRTSFFASFLFSGILHELALSFPVKAGFGLPLVYFTLQAAVQLAENSIFKGKRAFEERKWAARLWVYFWILAPAPLLFHPAFLKGVVWPLAGLEYPD